MEQEERKAEVSLDEELAALMAKGKALQEKENAGDGVHADYILLAKNGCKALKKTQKEFYIEGLKEEDFYIQGKKLILGNKLFVVPLAFITIYNEYSPDGKFQGTWNKEQACMYPVDSDMPYNRVLPNGNTLVPTNWVMVEVLGHSKGDKVEIENGVIAYKRTGSRIWRNWKKDAKNRSDTCATLVYKIMAERYENGKNDWLDINFEFAGSLLEKDKNKALYCLRKSNELREAYEARTLIQDRVIQDSSRLALSSPAAAETRSDDGAWEDYTQEDSWEEDGEEIPF